MLLRWWAVLTLGHCFTTKVMVVQEQRVISSGPYRMVRHPSYLGVLILFLGLGAALGSLASAVVMVVLPAIGLVTDQGGGSGAVRRARGQLPRVLQRPGSPRARCLVAIERA
jgi:protein-S-isoprenylcysteine O-methyltransferase Ste14